MVRITPLLLRRKAEHHDGLLSDLQELSLHQLELEAIEGLAGCPKLRILYLQSNVISRIQGLHRAHELRYLNLAVNNLTTVEGLGACEFLSKLDLTLNFIGVASLEASLAHLSALVHLRELYLMGNPVAVGWAGYRLFVVARLPQLGSLDGREVSHSERRAAAQAEAPLLCELRSLAEVKQGVDGLASGGGSDGELAEQEGGAWTPAARLHQARAVAAAKEAKEAYERGLAGRMCNTEEQQVVAVAAEAARSAAAACDPATEMRQCNEGRWAFSLEETQSGYELRLQLSRFLHPSLVHADVHPSHASVLVRGKAFRLRWPEAVSAEGASCQRSQATGELLIKVQREAPEACGARTRAAVRAPAHAAAAAHHSQAQSAVVNIAAAGGDCGLKGALTRRFPRAPTLAEELLHGSQGIE